MASLADYYTNLQQAENWSNTQYNNVLDALSAILELVCQHVASSTSNTFQARLVLKYSLSAFAALIFISADFSCEWHIHRQPGWA